MNVEVIVDLTEYKVELVKPRGAELSHIPGFFLMASASLKTRTHNLVKILL